MTDIAHALSMICRFTGHCRYFYSVAQHCLNMARGLKSLDYSPKIQLYGLLHDAAEAYICDIPGPLKVLLPEYKEIEDRIQGAIWEAFGLSKPIEEEYKIIKSMDLALFAREVKTLMKNAQELYISYPILNEEIQYEPMDEIKRSFIQSGSELAALLELQAPID